MIEIDSKLKKWGNSFGIIVPKDELINEGIKEGDSISVMVSKKKGIVKELFGNLKNDRSTEKELKNINKELDIQI
ncbi:hypothetical protein K8R33_02470 [archaeon]|nr:hypothetical protein [archaeon]